MNSTMRPGSKSSRAKKQRNFNIEIYGEKGFRMVGADQSIKGKRGGNMGKRSEIKGFSRSSRRRMREFMLRFNPPENYTVVACTLTVPGPVITREYKDEIWNKFSLDLFKMGACMLWRLEVQERKQPHWHVIIGLPPGAHRSDINELYTNAVNQDGPVEHHGDNWKTDMICIAKRASLPGADLHMIKFEDYNGKGAWLRYLQDHASKTKEGQIAGGWGRHWGIVGRARYQVAEPETKFNLTKDQYYKALRVLQRLATRTVKSESSVFGRKLGYRPSRGRTGSSVWFTKPSIVERVVSWAQSFTPVQA